MQPIGDRELRKRPIPAKGWTDPSCPVARTLDLVGDRWSLLIVRDAMDGATSFSDFHARTGIARNILTDRLSRLVEHGVLTRTTAPSGKRQTYELTDSGRSLFTVIVALRQWGEAHAFGRDEQHSVLVDDRDTPVADLSLVSQDGRLLDLTATHVKKMGEDDTTVVPACDRGQTDDGSDELSSVS